MFINNELIQVSLYSEENNEIIDGIWSIFENELDSIFEPYTKKHLDLIVLNSLNDQGAGFKTETNKVTFISKSGAVVPQELKPKDEVAKDLLHMIQNLMYA